MCLTSTTPGVNKPIHISDEHVDSGCAWQLNGSFPINMAHNMRLCIVEPQKRAHSPPQADGGERLNSFCCETPVFGVSGICGLAQEVR